MILQTKGIEYMLLILSPSKNHWEYIAWYKALIIVVICSNCQQPLLQSYTRFQLSNENRARFAKNVLLYTTLFFNFAKSNKTKTKDESDEITFNLSNRILKHLTFSYIIIKIYGYVTIGIFHLHVHYVE